MRVQMRQPVATAELFQVVRHAVRVHRRATVLREHKAAVKVIALEPLPLRALPCAIFTQQLHRLTRQVDIALRLLRLGRGLIHADVSGVQYAVADIHAVVFKVHVLPLQA